VEANEGAWNQALLSWFFRPDLAGRGVYLSVDEETLGQIADEWGFDGQDPTASLSQVVRHRVSNKSPLSSWTSEASRWRYTDSESGPPFLAILALTVLAATINDQINDRSYYRRLNALLGLPGAGMPRDFDCDIQQLWISLNEWLEHKCRGALGTPTATNIGGLANVGWAQSQILLRTSDRVKLPFFFTEAGLRPGQVVDGDLLVRRLRSWLADGRNLSRRLGVVLGDPRLSELLGETLHNELLQWDGTVRDEAGRMALRLLLAFHERTGNLEVASQIPEQLRGGIWSVGVPGSSCVDLRLSAADEFQLVKIPVTSSLLDGFPLQAKPVPMQHHQCGDTAANTRRSALGLLLPRRDVYLLSPDDRLARWVQVPTALLQRPHLVLVRSEAASAAARIMSQLGSRGGQPFTRIHKPAGWTAFKFIPERHQTINGSMAVLSPRGNEFSAMDGGLPISKRKRIYLTSGAPDIIWDLHEEEAPVDIDGVTVKTDTQDRLRLVNQRLGAGVHSINVGGVRYKLTLVDESADVSFEGNNLSTSLCGQVTGPVTVKGASIVVETSVSSTAITPRPVHTRAGGHHYVLGLAGEAAVVEMFRPKWLLDLHLNPHLADAEPGLSAVPFTPSWVLRVTRTGVTVSAVHAPTESGSRHSGRAISPDLWSEVIPFIEGAIPDAADRSQWAAWKRDALAHHYSRAV
jgi:hypothetical protein